MITPQELSKYRKISKKFNYDKIDECIDLAKTDMREAIGDRLFFDVMSKMKEISYEPLMKGSDFDMNGVTFNHAGLKAMFADFVYARYLYMVNINHSPTGLTQKESENSSNIERNLIKDLVNQAQIDADKKWELIKMFLENNTETYPVWNNNTNTNSDDVSIGQNRFTFLSTGRKSKI